MTDKMKNLIVRAITGAVFVVVMVGCMLNPYALICLFALITGLTIWEFCGLVNRYPDIKTNRFICTLGGVYLFLAMAGYCTGFTTGSAFIPYLIILIYLIISELFTKAPNPVNNWAYTMLSQMYIALPLSTVNILAFQTGGPGFNYELPLSIFIFLWVNDTGAYCAGSLFGKHKLFPRVSPGKSWEGSIGGAIFVILAAVAIGYFMSSGNIIISNLVWIGLGLVVVVFGTLGDLVESLFKRTIGVKDSGNILPGHGGMLDRFDSSLMAIPASVIYIYTISLF